MLGIKDKNSPYIKLFKERTPQFMRLPWQARMLYPAIVAVADYNGTIPLWGKEPEDVLSSLIGVPAESLKKLLAFLMAENEQWIIRTKEYLLVVGYELMRQEAEVADPFGMTSQQLSMVPGLRTPALLTAGSSPNEEECWPFRPMTSTERSRKHRAKKKREAEELNKLKELHEETLQTLQTIAAAILNQDLDQSSSIMLEISRKPPKADGHATPLQTHCNASSHNKKDSISVSYVSMPHVKGDDSLQTLHATNVCANSIHTETTDQRTLFNLGISRTGTDGGYFEHENVTSSFSDCEKTKTMARVSERKGPPAGPPAHTHIKNVLVGPAPSDIINIKKTRRPKKAEVYSGPTNEEFEEIVDELTKAAKRINKRAIGPDRSEHNKLLVAKTWKNNGATVEKWRKVIWAQYLDVRRNPHAAVYMTFRTLSRPDNFQSNLDFANSSAELMELFELIEREEITHKFMEISTKELGESVSNHDLELLKRATLDEFVRSMMKLEKSKRTEEEFYALFRQHIANSRFTPSRPSAAQEEADDSIDRDTHQRMAIGKIAQTFLDSMRNNDRP